MYPYTEKNMMPLYNIHCMPMKLASAYVPFQCITCIYPPIPGLKAGTIFPELDRPYGVDPEYTVDR